MSRVSNNVLLFTCVISRRYRTYFEDPENLAVFVMMMLVLTTVVGVGGYIFYQYVMKGGPLCNNILRTRYGLKLTIHYIQLA